MKKIVFLSLLLHQVWAFGYEIDYTRTYNKIVAENKDLKFHLNEDGAVSISVPTFNGSSPTYFTNPQKLTNDSIERLVDLVLEKKATSLNRKLDLIKNQQTNQRFYSSDVDLYSLVILKNGETLFQMKLSNWQELKHFYEQLGEWQPLVDLLNQIENQIIATKTVMKNGRQE